MVVIPCLPLSVAKTGRYILMPDISMIHTNMTSLITAWMKPTFLERLLSVTHVTVFVPHLQRTHRQGNTQERTESWYCRESLTALRLWSSIQHPEAVRVLLNYGADTNAHDNSNQTVLHLPLLWIHLPSRPHPSNPFIPTCPPAPLGREHYFMCSTHVATHLLTGFAILPRVIPLRSLGI